MHKNIPVEFLVEYFFCIHLINLYSKICDYGSYYNGIRSIQKLDEKI